LSAGEAKELQPENTDSLKTFQAACEPSATARAPTLQQFINKPERPRLIFFSDTAYPRRK